MEILTEMEIENAELRGSDGKRDDNEGVTECGCGKRR